MVSGVLLIAGCGGMPASPPPSSPPEYEQMRIGNRTAYPRQTVMLYNLQRVLDRDVPAPQRAASLKLVSRLGEENHSVRVELAKVLASSDTPAELRKEILQLLLKRNYPDLTGHIVQVLPELDPDDPIRATVLEWLARHPTPEVLSSVVTLWAKERAPSEAMEERYEAVVEKITRKSWDDSLLAGLNTDGFTAKGSALEVLRRRLPVITLRKRIEQMRGRTDAIVAMQLFMKRFDYLPASAQELLSTVWLVKAKLGEVKPASTLYDAWRESHGYVFNVRDFHLLGGLAGDPLRQNMQRSSMILQLGREFKARKHIRHQAQGRGRLDPGNFWIVSHKLSIADLWNIHLLNEMLKRRWVQVALTTMADKDLADKRSAHGGLVFYENGQAQARLYTPSYEPPASDLTYIPSAKAEIDSRAALSRFYGHFEKVNNASRAGPGREELRDAARQNYYGLILTSVSSKAFCAHYYNPEGVVVSIGVFPFGTVRNPE
jgi:hypothetical protein